MQHTIAIVGAGMIARAHLEGLKELAKSDAFAFQVQAICDIKKAKALALADTYKIPHVFDNIDELISSKLATNVHVLVPPNLHAQVAMPFLSHGMSVFLEKPMAETPEDCQKLIDTATANHARLWVNHNFAYQPSYIALKKIISSGSLGKIRHAILHWNFPLRQLNSQQFGHWMFQEPVNILLEQFVHPLSTLEDLLGGVHTVKAINLGTRELSPGKVFLDKWTVAVSGQNASAEVFFSVGTNYKTVGLMVIGDDGIAVADFVANTCATQHQTKWPEFYNLYCKCREFCLGYEAYNSSNFWNYLLSTLRLKNWKNPFESSMLSTISAFYANIPDQNPVLQAKTASHIVQLCHDMIRQVDFPKSNPISPKLYTWGTKTKFDAVLVGGTGFIGRKVAQKMVQKGKKVLVAARNISNLSSSLYHENIMVANADICDAEKMNELVSLAPVVVHLAHGGGGNSWQEIEASMIEGTKNIATACIQHKVQRLIYVGTIASLYLGNGKENITGQTPNDPKIEQRGLYSRGKAECEKILLDMVKNHELPLCMLRPGVVVGEGGLPFHSGIGLFNQDTYCIGWNKGQNPLPMVLVDDVAEAIILACENPNAIGRTFNVVGDVRLTAKEYVCQLAKALGRPLVYLPQPIYKSQSIEIFKWLVKVVFQRRKVAFPSLRDLKSRGMAANVDCTDIKTTLGWVPEKNIDSFVERGIRIHSV